MGLINPFFYTKEGCKAKPGAKLYLDKECKKPAMCPKHKHYHVDLDLHLKPNCFFCDIEVPFSWQRVMAKKKKERAAKNSKKKRK